MEYDLETSPENECKTPEEATEEPLRQYQQQKLCQTNQPTNSVSTWRLVNAVTGTAGSASALTQAKIALGASANKTLSSQVMEYYQKYSQTSNLNQYFSLPTSSNNSAEGAKYYYNIYDLSPKYIPGRQNCIGQDYNLQSYIPRERRRWVRPPLIGQSSSTDGSSIYVKSMTDPQSPRLQDDRQQNESQTQIDTRNQQQQKQHTSTQVLVSTEERSTETSPQEIGTVERKASSPTSSVASVKPLEWDSGADVGYLYENAIGGIQSRSGQKLPQLSTLERMALARGCSAALRLDPEGTTEQQQQQQSHGTAIFVVSAKRSNKPEATSTPLVPCNASGSESEIEITPIVKNHVPGILAGHNINNDESSAPKSRKELLRDANDALETPKSYNFLKLPHALKYTTPEESSKSSRSAKPPPLPVPVPNTASNDSHNSNNVNSASASLLKKSSSMNLLASPTARLPLKRSQSELNLCGNERPVPRFIFNSTSSIATVVNSHKPITCNKLIQTSMRKCTQESIGVQVSVIKEEEKPPLPKRATSLGPKLLNSILKNSQSTYKIQNPKITNIKERSKAKEEHNEKEIESTSDSSQNVSITLHADDTENITGRANSFEYFPGHIYQNVPNGSTSQVSSVDTGRSNSTMPNTSSSFDEKLWGDSDSLVRDLERSVNILKNLVDANKLDKQVKKRLIHHVVKRLVTAKYTDDKIEHNLEENVPWNPADARNKVYRTEIIQALAKNTTDSSDEWKPSQKKKGPKKSVPNSEARTIKNMVNIPAAIESSNSDKFDRNTDRTVMDGRKARMGLRADDCNRRSSSNTPTNKSESSECFLPHRGYNKNEEIKNTFISSTTNSSSQDHNRVLLDAVVNSRRSPVESSNEAGNSLDWRLPATASERRYELRRCSNSDSGDTKLVSYAEMEKRNQLIWITNEISHLSNLKKLLEQPKTKPERSNKSPPRKSKHSTKLKSLTSAHQHQHQNGDVLNEDCQLNRQWSSHCNLANCSPFSGVNSVKRLKKRNSCTQTATANSSAYSKTGSEIVSARIQSSNTKLISVYVQTSRLSPAPIPISSISQQFPKCPVHKTVLPRSCTCSERICLFCKSKNVSQQHRSCADTDRENVQIEAKLMRNDSEDMKEAKNQLNAIKLKCTCEVNHNDTVKQKMELPKKLESASQTCNQRHCDDSMCSCKKYKLTDSSCQCSKDCQCEKKLVCSFEKMRMSDQALPQKRIFDKANGTNCICECKKSEETQSSRSESSYHSDKKTQPYYLSNSSRESNSRDCCCENKTKNYSKIHISPKHSARSSSSTTPSNCKCCRLCGTVYQNERNCKCVVKNYPKSVAYELSFFDDDRSVVDNEVAVEIKSINRGNSVPSIKPRERSKRGDECACENSQPKFKHCECNCRVEQSRKRNLGKKNTLQEYLARNNPGFVDNVETRRQYVSEIQRLRQLRKNRRMQLLAMATTATNIFVSPRPTKFTKCVQKKISDQEMKARLRKRYLQLSEVRAKRKQEQLQEEARCNKLMAKIFCKKLQQKVLRGQVDLSQSVSVISNL